MKMMKRVSSLVLVLVFMMTLALTVSAATDPSVVYEGHQNLKFYPADPYKAYTLTDLFDNFKGVMPGDTLTEEIQILNKASCCSYIKVYMYAKPHNENTNPLSPNVSKDKETVATMEDFLSQLHMTVLNTKTNKTIFDASPDETAGLTNKVLLGSFSRNKGTTLKVTLDVPADLDNKYAFREGEVDWVFLVEEYTSSDNPKTGDHNNIYAAMSWLGIGAAGMLVMAVASRRKKRA